MTLRSRLCGAYFLLMASIGGLTPWMAVVLERAGIGARSQALILAAFPVGVLVAGPLGGWLADRTGREVAVLRVTAIVATIASFLLVGASGVIALGLGTAAVALFRAPVGPVMDMYTVGRLGFDRRGYGGIRAWGSIGFIVAAFGVGLTIERWPVAPLVAGAGTMALLAVATWGFTERERAVAPRGRSSLLELLRGPVMLPLCVTAVLHRATVSYYDLYYPLHTTETLHLPGWVAGASIAAGVGLEVAVLIAGHLLLTRLGPMKLILIALLASLPRWLLTAGLVSAIPLVLTQLLHGLSFGAWWVGAVALVARTTPEEHRTAAQGLFVAAAHGLGTLVALGFAATLVESRGTGGTFEVMALLSSAAVIVAVVWLGPAVRRAGGGRG